MKYDLEKILSFVKNDDRWIEKIVIGSLFTIAIVALIFILICTIWLAPKAFLPLLILCTLLSVIIGLAVYGYILQMAHDYITDSETKLPEWSNFGSHLFVGFKAALGSVLFHLPLLFLGAIGLSLIHYLDIQSETSESYKLVSAGVNIIAEIFYLIYMLLYPLFNANFIKDFNPFEFLNFSAAYKLLKNNAMDYLVLVLLILAMGVICNTSVLLLALTIIGILLIPFVSIYINIVCGILTARFVQIDNESKNLEEK